MRLSEEKLLLRTILGDLYEDILDEGLIRTVNLDDAAFHIMGALPRCWGYKKLTNRRFSIGSFERKLTDRQFDGVFSLVGNLGYFPSNYIILSHTTSKLERKVFSDDAFFKDVKNIVGVIFDARFPPSMKPDDIPDIVYHASHSDVERKILSFGLIPKSKNKLESHPDRIYLSLKLTSIEKLILRDDFLDSKKTSKHYSVFEIETKSLKMDGKTLFFEDPSHPNDSIFTYGNIHKKYITLLKRVSLT